MTMEITHFYLNAPLKWYKYFWHKFDGIPEDVIRQYVFEEKAMNDDWVYVEIRKGTYGLLQAGLLAHELLEED